MTEACNPQLPELQKPRNLREQILRNPLQAMRLSYIAFFYFGVVLLNSLTIMAQLCVLCQTVLTDWRLEHSWNNNWKIKSK